MSHFCKHKTWYKSFLIVLLSFVFIGGYGCSDASTMEQQDTSVTDSINTEPELLQSDAGTVEEKANADGFVLIVPGVRESVTLSPDVDMNEVLRLLGDAYSYYEAPSCAFHGLDKIYTYNDFEIDTYPDGETDRIYLITLLSDLIGTPEGLMIGLPEADIVALYGEPQEKKGNEYMYQKGKSKLGVVAKDGYVVAITYYSTVQ